MQDVHEDTTLNREVYDALSTLEHVRESPLGDSMFESLVSILPLVLDYSRAFSTGYDGMWGHDESGDSHEPHLQVSQ
jgi:hypothetical protein